MITDYIIHVEYFLFNCGIICWYDFFIFLNKKGHESFSSTANT